MYILNSRILFLFLFLAISSFAFISSPETPKSSHFIGIESISQGRDGLEIVVNPIVCIDLSVYDENDELMFNTFVCQSGTILIDNKEWPCGTYLAEAKDATYTQEVEFSPGCP